MDDTPTGGRKRISWLENNAFYVVLGVMFLLPIFFIPSSAAPFQFTKTALLIAGILIALFFYVVSRLEDGKVTIPYNLMVLTAWALPIVYLASAFFSDNLKQSLIGQSFEVDTFGFITAMVLLMTLVPLLLRKKEKVLRVYLILLISGGILAIYQGLRLFLGADFLSFDIFTSTTSNLVGKWNDLAIFFGLTAVLSLVTLEGLELSKQSKIIVYATLVVSLFFLSVINFFPVWLVVGIFALGFFVYKISKNTLNNLRIGSASRGEGEGAPQGQSGHKVSFLALVVLIITLAFVLFGDTLGQYTSSRFNFTQIEARPSWQATLDITQQVYNDDFLFGTGPNTFSKNWVKYKPQGINETVFWSVDFVSGIGFIPTAFISVGVIGGLIWLLFLSAFLYTGLRTLLFRQTNDKYVYYLTLSSFLASLYLWIMTIFYIPNAVMIAFAFFFSGVFISTLRHHGEVRSEREIVFAKNPRIGFVVVLLLTVFLIVDAVAIYIVGQQYLSTTYYQKSVFALNVDGDLDKAQQKLTQSLSLARNDRNLRYASDLQLLQVNNILNDGSLPLEEQRTQFQSVFSGAVQSAQAATDVNPSNYQNWMTLGRVYGSVIPLQIEGAYENAKRSYDSALELNPHNPLIYLTLAQLEAGRGDLSAAKEHVQSALEEKSNYTEAIFLLSQIQIQEGNTDEAIASVEAAAFLDSNNAVIFFQLGLLRYNKGDDLGAIAALEQAVALNNVYANAMYFLGLSYFREGRNDEAIAQFEVIAELNLGNDEVKRIIENLKAGRNPFSTDPLDQDGLPI